LSRPERPGILWSAIDSGVFWFWRRLQRLIAVRTKQPICGRRIRQRRGRRGPKSLRWTRSWISSAMI